ncbi:MAG: acyl-[acyl-carrier-protein]--UDP-N-acetylglucosamine O-acyltransferase, partial [Candidatus Omnitrophica bacterium]|nr:acyl-[acyl-carrier-protein]--UDP-N-acetylglucosamine O-acyltransferase [Candidatus Omnitrophota bacterium]
MKRSANIHPTACVHPNAILDDTVKVGPYSIIGEKVCVGAETEIGNACVLDGNTRIGKHCRIFTGAVIGVEPQDLKYKGEDTQVIIGDDNVIREYVTVNRGTGESGKTVI